MRNAYVLTVEGEVFGAIVFRFRFLYGFMFVYIYIYISVTKWQRSGFFEFTKLLLALSSFAQPFDQMRSIIRTLLYDTKPSPSLHRTFSRRNSWKKNRSDNKMAAPEASVHLVRNRLC